MPNEIKLYWTTKDGKKIDVDEMDIDHLRNVLKMILRKRQEIENSEPDERWYSFAPDIN